MGSMISQTLKFSLLIGLTSLPLWAVLASVAVVLVKCNSDRQASSVWSLEGSSVCFSKRSEKSTSLNAIST